MELFLCIDFQWNKPGGFTAAPREQHVESFRVVHHIAFLDFFMGVSNARKMHLGQRSMAINMYLI